MPLGMGGGGAGVPLLLANANRDCSGELNEKEHHSACQWSKHQHVVSEGEGSKGRLPALPPPWSNRVLTSSLSLFSLGYAGCSQRKEGKDKCVKG